MASFVKTITVLLVTLLLLSKSHSKRQKRFLFGQNGCQTLIQCLAAGNSLFPYRLNFNPITAYDRIESHLQGRNGWSRSETRNFQRQRNRIDRQRQRQEQRRKLHRQRLQLLRKRHQQVQDKIGIFQQTNLTYYWKLVLHFPTADMATKRINIQIFVVGVSLWLLGGTWASSHSRPHIIVIVADDLVRLFLPNWFWTVWIVFTNFSMFFDFCNFTREIEVEICWKTLNHCVFTNFSMFWIFAIFLVK